MKAIIMSINPEWVAKILNGEKRGEVRKNAPRQWLDYFNGKLRIKPCQIDVYIYCTAPNKEGGVIGRFDQKDIFTCYNRKVIGKFTLREMYIYDIKDSRTWKDTCFAETVRKQLSMSIETLHDYVGDNIFYQWRISDLVIFDKPKELSELGVKRAPQSWQYVEVLHD